MFHITGWGRHPRRGGETLAERRLGRSDRDGSTKFELRLEERRLRPAETLLTQHLLLLSLAARWRLGVFIVSSEERRGPSEAPVFIDFVQNLFGCPQLDDYASESLVVALRIVSGRSFVVSRGTCTMYTLVFANYM